MKSERGASVFIHQSQFPEAVRAELLRSLSRRQINHKFHYDSYKQAQKWLALHEAHSPARTDRQCLATYDAGFRATADKLASRRVRLVGLGCGGGQKDARLLQLLGQRRAQVAYVPCDVSMPLVLTARSRALRLVNPRAMQPIVCDLAGADDLSELIVAPSGEQRLITFFGMVPNFEPGEILPRLGATVRRSDWLLLSANLVPESNEADMQRILPQYDNELTRAWLMTFLLDLGVEANDGSLVFTIERIRNAIPLMRFVARFQFRRRRKIVIGTDEFAFKRGDAVRLFFSYRYTVETIGQWLARYGLRTIEQWVTPSGEEGIFLVRRLKK